MDKITVSYSEIKAWRFCKQSHYFKYVEKIIPRRKSKALKMGSVVHSLVQSVSEGKDYRPVLSQVQSEYEKMFEEEREYYGNVPEDSERIIMGYQKAYTKDGLKYSLIEKKLEPIKLTEKTLFSFRADRLATTPSGLTWLCETKTAKRIPGEEIRIWDLQTLLYVWALTQSGYRIDGILWDYIRTKPPTIPEILKSGELSKRKIDTTYEVYLEALKKHKLNPESYSDILEDLKNQTDKFYRRILLPVSENMILPVLVDARRSSLEIYYLKDKPVRSISGFTCPRCQYSSLCYAQMRGLDDEFIRKAEYQNKEEEIEYGEEDSESEQEN